MDLSLKELDIECEKLSDILSVDDIKAINQMITDSKSFENSETIEEENKLLNEDLGPGFEIDRDEDYHLFRSPGIIETLVETQLPMECKQNQNILWLTSIIMTEIAQNQAFSEGNKRTAYMSGTLFLIKCQLIEGDKAIYPRLDKELTDKLSDLALGKTGQKSSIDRKQFYRYLKNRIDT